MPPSLALYRLLVKLGANEAEAEAAAQFDTRNLATKADVAVLKTDLAELKSSLIMWMVGITFTAMGIQTALFIFVLTHYRP